MKNKKILFIARLLASIIVIVFAFIQILGILDKAIYVAAPLVGVVMLIQALQEWKKSRGLAIISLICATFIFICAIVAFLSL